MKYPRYKCPHCGSTNIVFAEETTTKRLFKLDQHGNRYKNPFETIRYYSDTVIEYLECEDCAWDCHLEDGVELKKWENPDYKAPAEKD